MDPAGLKNTEMAAAGILSLPMYPELSDEVVSRIVDTVRSQA
jgi:dTDP-4-amino-4,6-dideoxygalactose transaminase